MEYKYSKKQLTIGFLLILSVIAVSYQGIVSYLQISYTIGNLGLLLIPFILYVKQPAKYSYRYAIASIIALFVYLITSTALPLFLSICFIIYFIVEITFGKLNRLAPLVIVLVAPATKYFFTIFGFDIRLKLTQIASYLLNFIGLKTSVSGNFITVAENTFSVDIACVGLKMVISALLICLLLISYFEKRKKKEFNYITGLVYILLTFIFVIIANLLRITILIITKSAPETIAHEIIGILCFIFFIVSPLYFIGQGISQKEFIYAKRTNYIRIKLLPNSFIKVLMHTRFKLSVAALFIPILILVNIFTDKSRIYEDTKISSIDIHGYEKEVLPGNIAKFTSPTTLIYIKPQTQFYQGEHNPLICWRGSGYTMLNEKIIRIDSVEIYSGQISVSGQTWYTSWWYDNGTYQTVSQFDWRFRTIKGEDKFRLINVTSIDEGMLKDVVRNLLEKDLFHTTIPAE
jgi:exosortase N